MTEDVPWRDPGDEPSRAGDRQVVGHVTDEHLSRVEVVPVRHRVEHGLAHHLYGKAGIRRRKRPNGNSCSGLIGLVKICSNRSRMFSRPVW